MTGADAVNQLSSALVQLGLQVLGPICRMESDALRFSIPHGRGYATGKW